MLDIRIIREQADFVKARLADKNQPCDLDRILEFDGKRRDLIRSVDALKADRNKASEQMAAMKKAGQPADSAIAEMRRVGDQIAAGDAELRELEQQLNDLLTWIPNLPHESVPVGKDETANVVVRQWGEIPKPTFAVQPHWEIGQKLGILDMEAAAKVRYRLRRCGAGGFSGDHRT